jgi:hypothetical protein
MAFRHLLPMLLLACPAQAESLASGDAIRAALSGNSVQGSMLASGGYAEYYAPDGSIHAADYTGKWAIRGDRMCFAYGDDPASCWAAVIAGNHVIWIGTDGEEGSGTISKGNAGGW